MPKAKKEAPAKEKKESGYTIDVGIVIDKYNKDNPELRQLTQSALADELNITPATFSGWKKNAPDVVDAILTLSEKANIPITDFVTKKEK